MNLHFFKLPRIPIQLLGLILLFPPSATQAQSNAFSWGQGVWGKLGDGGTVQRNAPVAVSSTGLLAGKRVVAISGGSEFTVALTADGLLKTWGYNSAGQLGDGTAGGFSTAIVSVNQGGILSGRTVTAIAAGSNHTLAVTTDGNVFAWGDGESGKLGNGAAADAWNPVAAQKPGTMAGKIVAAIAAGSDHSLFLTADGLVFACGDNTFGALGDGTTTNRTTPVPVLMNGALAGLTVTKIAAGRNHSLALASNGRVYSWGLNSESQIGDGTNTTRTAPVAVLTNGALSGKTIVAADAGYHHSIVLDSEGRLYAWGWNVNGQLGDGTTAERSAPVAVSVTTDLASRTVADISGGRYHSMLRTTDGRIFCWGNGATGVLGNGGTVQALAPTLVPATGVLAGRFITHIAAGGDHSLALSSGSEIAVETAGVGDLTDGVSVVAYGVTVTGRTHTTTFTVRNTGLDSLTGLSVSFSGAGAGEFSIITVPVSPVLNGGQTPFTIQFAPLTAGTKTVLLRIASNDIDETPFDISLSATALLPGADEDSDGVTNEAELNLASLGFDPFQPNAALRQLLHANARGLGLYQASDMQSLALGNPMLQRNPATGNFTLRVEVLRSPDLLNWTLLPGTADLTFSPAPTGPEFYRVFQVVP